MLTPEQFKEAKKIIYYELSRKGGKAVSKIPGHMKKLSKLAAKARSKKYLKPCCEKHIRSLYERGILTKGTVWLQSECKECKQFWGWTSCSGDIEQEIREANKMVRKELTKSKKHD